MANGNSSNIVFTVAATLMLALISKHLVSSQPVLGNLSWSPSLTNRMNAMYYGPDTPSAVSYSGPEYNGEIPVTRVSSSASTGLLGRPRFPLMPFVPRRPAGVSGGTLSSAMSPGTVDMTKWMTQMLLPSEQQVPSLTAPSPSIGFGDKKPPSLTAPTPSFSLGNKPLSLTAPTPSLSFGNKPPSLTAPTPSLSFGNKPPSLTASSSSNGFGNNENVPTASPESPASEEKLPEVESFEKDPNAKDDKDLSFPAEDKDD